MSEIYETFLISAILAGKIAIPDFWEHKELYLGHEWVASPKKWIDPKKESEANATALQSGQKTFKQIAAEQGVDWKRQLEDMAEVQEYAAQLGVKIGGVTENAQQQQQDPPDPDDEPQQE